jgi:DNA repair protein RecN (Recombination protein N)
MAQLEELALQLRGYQDRLDVAPGRLDEVESRLALIERLERKYGASVEEVLAFARQCRAELEALGRPEEQEALLEQRRGALASDYLKAARALSRQRREAAVDLEKSVQAELGQLAMEHTVFRVAFEPPSPGDVRDPQRWTERGLERAEFLLSPNPGEELRPLARIASGGELSRIMLALQSVVHAGSRGVTMIFDEVDAGIGGRVAEVVGRKLKAASARQQVLCVTHLPQIAALADHHLAVRKQTEGDRTVTLVECLSPAERSEEIARMLGGEVVTDTARRHAGEMLKRSLR